MDTIQFEMTVDEDVACVMPKLRPMVGRRVEVTAVEAGPLSTVRNPTTLDDFLAQRLKRPRELEPLTLADMAAIPQRAWSRQAERWSGWAWTAW